MPNPITITPAILDTVLGHLAPHFMAAAGNDLPTARHAASRILARYDAATEDELRLAAEIVSFSFQALEALSEAANPDLSVSHRLRLRSSAVSLSRQSHKSQRKLDQLQSCHRTAVTAAEPVESEPPHEAEPDPPPQAAAKPPAPQPRPLSRQQRRAAERLAEKVRRNKAEQERREAMKAAKTTQHLAAAAA